MTKDELLALAERVEALTGPDREVDADLMAIQHFWARRALSRGSPFRDRCWVNRATGQWMTTAKSGWDFTKSIDAAMALVPEGWQWGVRCYDHGGFQASVWWPWESGSDCVYAPTPALALVAAALRALAQETPHD